MKTLQEDIDDLDRMVDTGAAKDAIRSQIRLIAREVAALEADYSRLEQSHQAFKISTAKELLGLKTDNAKLKTPPTPTVGGFGGKYVDLSTD